MTETGGDDPFQRHPRNQPPPLVGHHAVLGDLALLDAIDAQSDDAPGVVASLDALGVEAGSAELREHGRLANAHPPVLLPVDRYGERVDRVEFHPSWHHVLRAGVGHGLAGAAWTDSGASPHVRRAAGYVAWAGVEPGHVCPMTMTYAALPALRNDAGLFERWAGVLGSLTYDPGERPATHKTGALAGMGMTEKQGGSDLRGTLTRAVPDGDACRLTGHKWFTSAPMNDVFLMLAQRSSDAGPDGLSCFVVPRLLPDGTRNAIRIVRLKDKLGNRSNASAELELDGTWAEPLGPAGAGVRTIIDMVAATRLDCVLGSTALMRRAISEAAWHAAHRSAFGRTLAEQPAMAGVLADLQVEYEAAVHLGLRLAAAVGSDDPHERALLRIGLPLAKFWVCKRTPTVCVEAMECLGGNGYVEDSGLPLLVRESPLNSIWEGSGTVNALDLLRAISRTPDVVAAWRQEVGRAGSAELDRAADALLTDLAADPAHAEASARRIAARAAVLLQAALLARCAPPSVADAFRASRVAGDWGGVYGTLPAGAAMAELAERAQPMR